MRRPSGLKAALPTNARVAFEPGRSRGPWRRPTPARCRLAEAERQAVTMRRPSGLKAALQTLFRVAFEFGDLAARGGVPHPRGIVGPRRGTQSGDDAAAVGAEGGAPDPLVWPSSLAVSRPVAASHTRAVLSSDAVTMRRPSGLKAAL